MCAFVCTNVYMRASRASGMISVGSVQWLCHPFPCLRSFFVLSCLTYWSNELKSVVKEFYIISSNFGLSGTSISPVYSHLCHTFVGTGQTEDRSERNTPSPTPLPCHAGNKGTLTDPGKDFPLVSYTANVTNITLG